MFIEHHLAATPHRPHWVLLIAVLALLRSAASGAEPIPTLDPEKAYRLEELIDIAERAHPRTKLAWAQLDERAAQLGVTRAERWPTLAAVALGASQHSINPFPKPLAPNGYTMVDLPAAEGAVRLKYVLYDFGRRGARIERARQLWQAAQAATWRETQSVAFDTTRAYYGLLTAEERLQAATQIVETARTTQTAAEQRLANGRATLPDVLNARATTAQAVYDQAVAEGRARTARVELREAVGVEPNESIRIDTGVDTPEPGAVAGALDELVHTTLAARADVEELTRRVDASSAELRELRADLKPSVTANGAYGLTALWPLSDYGTLGSARRITWSSSLQLDWNLFDGGQRRARIAEAKARERSAQAALRLKRDQATREVWSAFVRLQTAVRRREAARTLLQAAETGYAASFEAYQYGVKNLVDVVSAEQQLSQARLASVEARSELRVSAVGLDYATGTLLQGSPYETSSGSQR